jgi:hypothetical protein
MVARQGDELVDDAPLVGAWRGLVPRADGVNEASPAPRPRSPGGGCTGGHEGGGSAKGGHEQGGPAKGGREEGNAAQGGRGGGGAGPREQAEAVRAASPRAPRVDRGGGAIKAPGAGEGSANAARARPSGRSPHGVTPAPSTSTPRSTLPAPRPPVEADLNAIGRQLRQELTELRYARAARALKAGAALLQLVGAVSMLASMTDMAKSKLSGSAFVLDPELKRAREAEAQSTSLQSALEPYEERVYNLNEAFTRAQATRASARDALLVAYEVSADLDNQIISPVSQMLSALRRYLAVVSRRRRLAESILNDPVPSRALAVATMGTAELALIFAASEDLLQIESALEGAQRALRDVHGRAALLRSYLADWSAVFRARMGSP